MEIQNASDLLSKALADRGQDSEEIESIHRAELDAKYLQTVLDEPEVVLKTLGIKVSAESQIQVTAKQRAHRQSPVRWRRIIIIVIHWRNCDSDIIIILS